ncbi:hypothetical protein HY490_04825 [Candidatus Woesearchaeota archaeon]|nr:hypothetical protein [Candidatus Woesearchaeota archaeon]
MSLKDECDAVRQRTVSLEDKPHYEKKILDEAAKHVNAILSAIAVNKQGFSGYAWDDHPVLLMTSKQIALLEEATIPKGFEEVSQVIKELKQRLFEFRNIIQTRPPQFVEVLREFIRAVAPIAHRVKTAKISAIVDSASRMAA